MTDTDMDLHTTAHDDGAERAVLGAVILSKDARNDVEATLTPGDFYQPAHATIWAAVMDLHGQGQPVDHRILTDTLRKTGDLARVGGPAYLFDLTGDLVTAANAGWHARIVRETAALRVISETGLRLAHLGTEPGTDVVAALESAEKAIDAASGRIHGTITTEAADFGDSLDATMDLLEHGSRGIPTGFPDLDYYTGGMRPGSLITIAALSSGGKSMVAENIALNVAMGPQRLPVFVASLEMTRDEWNQRAFAQLGEVDLGRLMRGHLDEAAWTKVAHARRRLADVTMRVDDREDLTVPEIRAAARAWFRRHGPGLIVVDYLQMVKPTGRHGTREREVAEIADGLKSMAKALQVPVLALAQLSKDHLVANRRPGMHDLRESQAIAQYSDLVVLLNRDEKVPDVLDVGVGKNRHGPKGYFELQWQGHYARVRSPDQDGYKGQAPSGPSGVERSIPSGDR